MSLSDEELLDYSPQEARELLEDEELERYNELKHEELEKELKGYETDKKKEAGEGLSVLRDAVEQELTTTVSFGDTSIEVLVDPDINDFKEVQEIAHLEDKEIDKLSDKEIRKIKNSTYELLGEISIKYSKEDWRNHFNDAGLISIGYVVETIFEEIDVQMEQKKRR